MITQSALKELLKYDPDTGLFAWKNRRIGVKKSLEAGSMQKNGYFVIGIRGKKYYSHRLAWLHEKGEFPPDNIDHINGNRQDNRMCNLRAASVQQNNFNRAAQRNNKSGYKGVCWSGIKRKWQADICLEGRHVCLGYFHSPAMAHLAYCKAAKKHFGEYARYA